MKTQIRSLIRLAQFCGVGLIMVNATAQSQTLKGGALVAALRAGWLRHRDASHQLASRNAGRKNRQFR
jgi:hypothetical protein